jgi:hypothetical protein
MGCRSNEVPDKKQSFSRNGSVMETKPNKTYRELVNE